MFMKLKTESKADNYCMVLQIWRVFLLFERQISETVTSEDSVCKQLKKHCNRFNINYMKYIIRN